MESNLDIYPINTTLWEVLDVTVGTTCISKCSESLFLYLLDLRRLFREKVTCFKAKVSLYFQLS